MKNEIKDLFLYNFELNNTLSILNNTLDNYTHDQNSKIDLIELARIINEKYKYNLPLPSGRYGNVLAYAMEMQKYYGALKIFEKSKDIGITTSIVAISPVGEESWDAKSCFEYSSKLWENNKDYFYSIPKIFITNKMAILKFQKIFNIKSDKYIK